MAKKIHPLTAARELKGLTLQQAADILHVSVATVWNWEQPIKYPTYRNILKIQKVFGVTPGEIFGFKPLVKRGG